MKNHNLIKYNLGFSLIEVIIVISITIILSLGISSLYTFITKENIKAKRAINVKTTIDSIKHILISDYKFHRGGNPGISFTPSVALAINPNIRPIGLKNTSDNNILEKSNINGTNFVTPDIFTTLTTNRFIQMYKFFFAYPLTTSELQDNENKFNTKFFTIDQIIQTQDNDRIIRRIYYSMSCQPLPNNITKIFEKHNTNINTLLKEPGGFYDTTKCIKADGIYTVSITDNVYYSINTNSCKDNEISVINRDVWDNTKTPLWIWSNPLAREGKHGYWKNGTLKTQQTFPNPKSIGSDTILGMAFCMWVPSEEDIVTANTTEIELYYYMLDNSTLSHFNKTPKLEVKKERISLHRNSSISSGLYPIKEVQ